MRNLLFLISLTTVIASSYCTIDFRNENDTYRNVSDNKWEFLNFREICMESEDGTLVRNNSINIPSRKNKLPSLLSCGEKLESNDTNDDDIVKRLSQASEFMPHEWPWLVAIGLRESGPICGGVLIGKRWVVTAAHCLSHSMNPCDYVIRAGEHHLGNPEENHIDVIASRLIMHPDASFTAFANQNFLADLALIQLAYPVGNNNDNIDYACLPVIQKPIPTFSLCYIAGWGLIDDSPKLLPYVPHHLPVLLWPDYPCGLLWNARYKPPMMICAADLENQGDTCSGDSGGALMCPDEKGRYRAFGVLSFGHSECESSGVPSGYTSLSHYRAWIRATIKQVEKEDKNKEKREKTN